MRAALLCLVLASLPVAAAADTVVLKTGKRIECVVSQDGDPVVINPYNSRCPEMTWGITEKERIPRDKVAEVLIGEPPLVEYRERASRPGLTGPDHLELALFCEKHKLAEERERELRLCLCQEPDNAVALAALGRAAWQSWAKGNPLADPDLRQLESEYVKLEKPAEAQAHWELMLERGTTRSRTYLERARRGAKFAPGRREKVPLTCRSEMAPGATYAIHVPKSYDPLVATGLVVGLHGGGPGGADPTLVTGSGESALDFYTDVAEAWGFLVVCPTALAAGWGDRRNEALLDALLEEMRLLYNVDENRVWLTGHSMGGFGAWHWGPARADVWAAFAPCAGGGGPQTGGVPVYVYHGADDQIVGVANDRASAESLRGARQKVDFVYTEVPGVGHGFPDWVRKDIFRFFAGRWKDDGQGSRRRATGPRSSFDRKVGRDEVKCFGDPSAPAAPADADDAKLGELVAALSKGGGRGVEASKELASRRHASTVTAVARVLHAKKASTDARVLAARTLGELGLPEALEALAAETSTEDFRVLDAVTEALGRLGTKDAAEPLVRAARQFGAFWDGSSRGGVFSFTEYETRCGSFALLCDALAAVGDAKTALPVLEKEVVARVFTPKTPYSVPVDSRFTHIPPRARLTLVKRLRACLATLRDRRGVALLDAIAKAWPDEPALVEEAKAGI